MKLTKSTTADSAEAMIIIKPEMTPVNDVLKEKKGRRPFILAIGSVVNLCITQYFVCVQSVAIPCGHSFFLAMDTCFKSYHILQIEYPSESKPHWLFIEHGVFQRVYGKRIVPSSVRALIGQILPKSLQ